jgi:fucose 4-O-acetylase-like acetyltransferase
MATQLAGQDIAQPVLVETGAAARPRLAYLDNVRWVLITSVVLIHLSVTYGVPADWTYYEGGEVAPLVSLPLLLVAAIGANFAMGLFFLIAGYFTPAAYDHKGSRRFLIDRFKRLGIPWLFFEILINPLVHYAVDVHGGDCKGALYDCQYQGTFWQYLKDFPRAKGSIGDGPVWFLEALLLFSIVYALWRILNGPAPVPALSQSHRTHIVPSNRSIALFALAIGLVSFVVRFWAKAFVQYEPFHLEYARFPQYVALFVAGIWTYRHDWLVTFSDRQARTWRWIALGCALALPALLVMSAPAAGALDERAVGGVNELSLALSLLEGFLSVSMVITILAWFRRRFNHQGRLARIMAESSFAVYVLHPAIIIPLPLALSGIKMNLSLKFLLVAPLAVALCYLSAYGLRKLPLARSMLG